MDKLRDFLISINNDIILKGGDFFYEVVVAQMIAATTTNENKGILSYVNGDIMKVINDLKPLEKDLIILNRIVDICDHNREFTEINKCPNYELKIIFAKILYQAYQMSEYSSQCVKVIKSIDPTFTRRKIEGTNLKGIEKVYRKFDRMLDEGAKDKALKIIVDLSFHSTIKVTR